MNPMDDIAFPLKVLSSGKSWVSGVVLADAEGHPLSTFGDGDEAVRLAEWVCDASNAYRAEEQR